MPTILVIDDSPAEGALMACVLKQNQFTTLSASDGLEGEALALAQKPNLILLDIVMPGRDGFQTCRVLKRNPQTAHIPVILVSSKNTESDRFWGLKQGASAYITKPFQPEDLMALVHQHLPAAR